MSKNFADNNKKQFFWTNIDTQGKTGHGAHQQSPIRFLSKSSLARLENNQDCFVAVTQHKETRLHLHKTQQKGRTNCTLTDCVWIKMQLKPRFIHLLCLHVCAELSSALGHWTCSSVSKMNTHEKCVTARQKCCCHFIRSVSFQVH